MQLPHLTAQRLYIAGESIQSVTLLRYFAGECVQPASLLCHRAAKPVYPPAHVAQTYPHFPQLAA